MIGLLHYENSYIFGPHKTSKGAALVFCHKIIDIGSFVYKIKLFVVIWIATAYNEQDVTICKQL